MAYPALWNHDNARERRPRVEPDSLAYAVVRLTEGFIYNDALATVEPAVDRAAEIVALLLLAAFGKRDARFFGGVT